MRTLSGIRRILINSTLLLIMMVCLFEGCVHDRETVEAKSPSRDGFVFDQFKLYLVTVKAESSGPLQYVVAGGTILGMWQFTRYANDDLKEFFSAIKKKEILEITPGYPFDKLVFRVKQSNEVDEYLVSHDIRDLEAKYFDRGYCQINDRSVYVAKKLIEAGIDVRLDEMFGRFYIHK